MVTSLAVLFQFLILSPTPFFYFIVIIEGWHLKIQMEISVLFHEGCVCVQPSALSQILKGI